MKKLFHTVHLLLLILITAAYAECNMNEIFNDFYKKFKVDHEFRISRTVFPLKVTEFIGDDEFAKPKILHVNKSDLISGKYILYPNYKIIIDQGYVEVFNKMSPNEIKLLIGPPKSEAAVSYIFKKFNGCWYLTEHLNLWGS